MNMHSSGIVPLVRSRRGGAQRARRGDPPWHVAQEIVALAKASKFELIVLGSKSRSAVAGILLGWVAQRVLATAAQPVLLVK